MNQKCEKIYDLLLIAIDAFNRMFMAFSKYFSAIAAFNAIIQRQTLRIFATLFAFIWKWWQKLAADSYQMHKNEQKREPNEDKIALKWALNCVQRHLIWAPAEDFIKLTVNMPTLFSRKLCGWTTEWICMRMFAVHISYCEIDMSNIKATITKFQF